MIDIHRDLFEAHAALEPRWLDAASDVHGIGIGRRQVCGRLTEDVAVRVYVVRKRACRALGRRDRLPVFIDGIPIDVIESERPLLHAARPPANPVCSGSSTGCRSIPFGTIAAFARSTNPADDPGRVLVLSNNHVFANLSGQPGDPIFQPGVQDSAAPLNQYATLLRAFAIEPGTTPNQIDAAVAALDAGIAHDVAIPETGPLLGSTRARLNFLVTKFGRTTGRTTGVVTDLHCTELVGLDIARPTLTARFVEQIRIDAHGAAVFADKGDSGSLVVESGTGQAVGLYFAGPPSGRYGLANHMATVLERLQIQLLTA